MHVVSSRSCLHILSCTLSMRSFSCRTIMWIPSCIFHARCFRQKIYARSFMHFVKRIVFMQKNRSCSFCSCAFFHALFSCTFFMLVSWRTLFLHLSCTTCALSCALCMHASKRALCRARPSGTSSFMRSLRSTQFYCMCLFLLSV